MKPLIVGNWKCNPTTLQEARRIFNSIKKGIKNIKNVEVVICPPFQYLLNLEGLILGAQDTFWEDSGAYTGEVSPLMLKNMGVKYVIIGHSERRKYFRETDEMINKKLKVVFRSGLKPILCIDKISQIKEDLKGISERELKNLIIAFEPPFAIGTGKGYDPQKAKKMRLLIQKSLKQKIRIIYGASVNPQNARDYIRKAGFQGLLPGGASLRPQEFIDIIKRTC